MSDGDRELLEALEARLGVRFTNSCLLAQALVNRSLLREPGYEGRESNERLEFLGDAIIGAVVARFLYEKLPNATEGELTLLRTWFVRASTLADWARRIELEHFIRLGRSDETTSRRTKLLARTFEAVVGAIYIDRGVRGVTAFLKPFVVREFKIQSAERPRLDAKSRLQQVSQGLFEAIPAYRVTEVTGPGHDPSFTVEVRVGAALTRTGVGRTKQEAEQAAAQSALEELDRPAAAEAARRDGWQERGSSSPGSGTC